MPVTSTTFDNLEELRAMVDRLVDDSRALGHHPSTVFIRPMHLNLVEDTLSDGSTVLNALVYEVL